MDPHLVAGSLFLHPSEALRDLMALEAIEGSPSISQRDLAQRLGIALGLTNACVSKMARKGLIKICRINSRSLTYHLTPAGFATKARLSMDYARSTIGFYRTARQAVGATIAKLALEGTARVGLAGVSDMAEIVGIVCVYENILIEGIADVGTSLVGTSFMGFPVTDESELAATGCDTVIVTYLNDTEHHVARVRALLPAHVRVAAAIQEGTS